MKISLFVAILAGVSAVAVPSATAQSKPSQEGIIVNVNKQDVASPPVRAGANPDHAPLQSHSFLYNVSVQLNCDIYVGRYESESDDLPDALSPNNHVPIRIEKHVMYLDFPGDPVKMQIVRHKVSQADACGQAGLAKQ
jgi:hypothetical protein